MDELDQSTLLSEEELEPEAPEVEEKPASLEDTVRAAYETVKPPEDEEESPKAPEIKDSKGQKIDPKVAREAIFGKGKKGKVKEAQSPDPKEDGKDTQEILPPAPLNAQQKEVFHRLPPELKKGVSDVVANLQAHATKLYQEYGRATKASEGIMKAIQPYIPDWNLKGVQDLPAALAQICAGQKYLDDHREDGVVKLASLMGLDRKLLAQKLLGVQGEPQNNSQNDAYRRLTEELGQLKLWKEQQEGRSQTYEQQVIANEGRRIALEIDQFRNQRDGQGRFLYPKLHDANYLKQIEPLVNRLQEINPQLPWSEHYKRAYHSTEGWGANPSLNSATGLSSSNGNSHIAKAKAASVSLKGRGAAPQAGFDANSLPQKTEDSVRLAWEMMTRNN